MVAAAARGARPWRPVEPEIVDLARLDGTRHVLAWKFPEPVASIGSAPVGGGSAAIDWLANIGVTADYGRTDLAAHARSVGDRLGFRGPSAAMFTAVDVRRVTRADDGAVATHATVGVSKATWAADDDHTYAEWGADGWIRTTDDRGPASGTERPSPGTERPSPGTINLVVQLPVALSPAAAVNAVMTATEAKVQALVESGVPGTGTASDAVVVCWPGGVAAEPFAGPRSTWGARLARSVHAAVLAGLDPASDEAS